MNYSGSTSSVDRGFQPFEAANAQRSSGHSNIRISERSIDEARPLKLIYIGAGISGIIAAIEFVKRVPHLDLVIYEKNPEIGGTWFENRYVIMQMSSSKMTDFATFQVPGMRLW